MSFKSLIKTEVKTAYSPEMEFWITILLTVAHLPVGILLYNFKLLGVIHPFAVLLLGLYFAFQKKSGNFDKAAYITAYLTGTEVLWRMSDSPIFWEFGKYAISAIMVTAMLRQGSQKIPILPFIYIALLVPACFLTLFNSDLNDAKSKISSTISGPLLIFISCWFFSHLQFNWLQIRRLLLALIIPIITVGATTLFYTLSATDIAFNTESNHATSGGFGPNQVSSILGLGAFSALLCLILMNNHYKFKIYFGLAIILLAAQSVMTFSRGGMYDAIGAILIVIVVQARDLKKGLKALIPLGILLAFFLLFIFPLLDDFTGGQLQQRFEDTGTSNRTEIIETDLEILFENPLFGIGVGESKIYRRQTFGYTVSSHTEFSRLISEHGMFGIAALVALLLMAVINFNRQKTIFGKAFVAGMLIWSSLYMLNSGMRLATSAFIWGISFIAIVSLQKANELRFDDKRLRTN